MSANEPASEQPSEEMQPSHLMVPTALGEDSNAPTSPYGGSPTKGEKSLEMEHQFDETQDYFGIEKKRFFEMIERRSQVILQEFGGVDNVARSMEANLETGLEWTQMKDPETGNDIPTPESQAEIDRRITSFGVNILVKKEPATFWEFFVEACADQVVIILAVAAVVSIILGMTVPNPHSGHVELDTGWIEGTAIIISIAVVTLTGSINNYQKALQFEEMEREQNVKDLDVLRSGEKVTIKSDNLVVGDILYLHYGMELSADGLILQASELKMNESAITGESDEVKKHPVKDPFIISGTSVENGTGSMMVIGVGMNSFQGQLKKSLDNESEETPLQEHLTELADLIGYFGFALAFVLIAALCLKEGIQVGTGKKELGSGTQFLNFFLIAVTLVVVAIPEGLPLAVTIALAFAMKAMMDDQCMVRVLASCETMGAATAVCSDKTGTLTTNIMTCVQGCIGGEEFVIDGYQLAPRHELVHVADRTQFETRINKDVEALFAFSVSVNSTADEEERDGEMQWRGNKTEIGMLKLLKLMNCDIDGIRAQYPHTDEEKMKQFPFNSAKKRMTTIVREESGGSMTAHVKGASEVILGDCDMYLDTYGKATPMTDDTRAIFNDVIENMAEQGNRTIGVACLQNMTTPDGQFPEEDPEDLRFCFIGVVGIQDPIRPEVPKAVTQAHDAGLIVRMVTGDNIVTAISIAEKCGIYEDNGWDVAMLGMDFRAKADADPEELKQMLPRLKVLARSSPSDKHILVGMLRDMGEVVGVTGDGTNDAPALKLADVGFAMKSGTDIAKGASDMVLLDDNFATVVTAIKWGRAVNDNIKKFLQFQLTINVSGVFLTLIASLVSDTSKEPFTPVQLLWLNLIMDTLAALSLATELPEEASLSRNPVFKDAPLITKRMWCFIAVHGAWQFILILVLLLVGHEWFHTVENENLCDKEYTLPTNNFTRTYCDKLCTHEGGKLIGGSGADRYVCKQGTVHSTFMFNVFIWTQVFNVVNSRKIHGEMNPLEGLWDRSKQLLLIFALIGGLQAIAVELFGKFMSTTPLSGMHWGASIGISAITIIIGIFQRFIPIEEHIPDSVQERWDHVAELRKVVGATDNLQEHFHATHHHEGAQRPLPGVTAATSSSESASATAQ